MPKNIIVGAGPIGLVTALNLLQVGVSAEEIIIIEQRSDEEVEKLVSLLFLREETLKLLPSEVVHKMRNVDHTLAYQPIPSEQIEYSHANIQIKHLVKALREHVKELGIMIHYQQTLTFINSENKQCRAFNSRTLKQTEYNYEQLIFAMGFKGTEKFIKQMRIKDNSFSLPRVLHKTKTIIANYEVKHELLFNGDKEQDDKQRLLLQNLNENEFATLTDCFATGDCNEIVLEKGLSDEQTEKIKREIFEYFKQKTATNNYDNLCQKVLNNDEMVVLWYVIRSKMKLNKDDLAIKQLYHKLFSQATQNIACVHFDKDSNEQIGAFIYPAGLGMYTTISASNAEFSSLELDKLKPKDKRQRIVEKANENLRRIDSFKNFVTENMLPVNCEIVDAVAAYLPKFINADGSVVLLGDGMVTTPYTYGSEFNYHVIDLVPKFIKLYKKKMHVNADEAEAMVAHFRENVEKYITELRYFIPDLQGNSVDNENKLIVDEAIKNYVKPCFTVDNDHAKEKSSELSNNAFSLLRNTKSQNFTTTNGITEPLPTPRKKM